MRRLAFGAVPLALAILLLSPTPTLAQEGSATPQWLDYMVGEWTATDSDGSSGTSACKWVGDSFVQCEEVATDASGNPGAQLWVMGYDAEGDAYNLSLFAGDGHTWIATGTFQDDTMTWLGRAPLYNADLRVINVIESQTAMTWKMEGSMDGVEWNLMFEGRSTRVN
jgi:hypothetical protein